MRLTDISNHWRRRHAYGHFATRAGTARSTSTTSTPRTACDAMSDELIEDGDLRRALQRLFREGLGPATASACPACGT